MPRFFYSLLLYCILPFTPLKLLWRGIKQAEYRQHWAERYGFYRDKPQKPLIWLHCVSLGETRAAVPLIKALQQAHPQHQILLTHATPTGRQAGIEALGDTVMRCYLPYDVPFAVNRFLEHYRPALGMLMETELWFNLIAGCKKRSIPILLVNARLSKKSAAGYANVSRLTEEGLHNLTAIAAQTEADAERLQGLGGHDISVMGNIKFDVTPPADAASKGDALRALLGKNRPVFLAASTRDGEEEQILLATQGAAVPNLLTMIVPRHPQRFDEVATMLTKRGIKFVRRSNLLDTQIEAGVEVVLGDTMGEMFTYYAACDVAFIGGSLQPLGGQNLIEASTMGKPVLIGPHTFNFELATELAISARAAWRVSDSSGLAAALQRLFGDPEGRQSMSWAALEFSRSAGGATQRIAKLAASYLK